MNQNQREDNPFASTQPAQIPAINKPNDFQSLVRTAVDNVTRTNGRKPILVPVSDSIVGLYANSDIIGSAFEDPWNIIQKLAARQTDPAQSFLPLTSTTPGNTGSVQQDDPEEQHDRIGQRLHSNGYEMRQAGLPPTNKNPVDRIFGKRKRNESVADNTSALSRSLRHKSMPVQQIPRSPHFRKFYMRVFSSEIQSIMHGFGEVRCCSPTVLEFVEKTVRNVTQRVALGILSRFNTEALTVSNISTCIRKDPNALHRLLFCLLRARVRGEDLHVVRPIHRDWDSFLHHATIHGIKIGEFPSLKILELVPVVKAHNKCAETARSIFWRSLGVLFKLQHNQGIQSSLTARESRYPLKGVHGRRRVDIFREWLALPDYVRMTEGSLHALGSLTREAIGIITQTALVLRLRSESFQSYEKLLVIALGYGIAAGIALPLSGLQSFELLSVLEDMESRVKKKEQCTIQTEKKEEALQMKYVREAWRQLDDPDALGAHRPFWFGM